MKGQELEIIYMHYYKPLLLYAFSLTHCREDAEDLVANTFMKALLSFEDGNIQAWLYRVLKNEFYNMYKRQRKIIFLNDEQWESPTQLIHEFFQQEQKRWLYKHIYQLPDKERQIMLLSLETSLNDAMISKMVGLSIENIRVIRHRVKKKLIDLYQKEENL